MIHKFGNRFSEKIMLQQEIRAPIDANATQFQMRIGSAFNIDDDDAVAQLLRHVFEVATAQPRSSADVKNLAGKLKI